MELLLALAIVTLVAAFVAGPLRRPAEPELSRDRDAELADLEAQKEAKYREIRDAESDRLAGKISEEDHRRADSRLRAEAIAILKRIDQVSGSEPDHEAGGAPTIGPPDRE